MSQWLFLRSHFDCSAVCFHVVREKCQVSERQSIVRHESVAFPLFVRPTPTLLSWLTVKLLVDLFFASIAPHEVTWRVYLVGSCVGTCVTTTYLVKTFRLQNSVTKPLLASLLPVTVLLAGGLLLELVVTLIAIGDLMPAIHNRLIAIGLANSSFLHEDVISCSVNSFCLQTTF